MTVIGFIGDMIQTGKDVVDDTSHTRLEKFNVIVWIFAVTIPATVFLIFTNTFAIVYYKLAKLFTK